MSKDTTIWITGASSGIGEAIAKTREFTPDLVIMDIQMPHISGLDLIEAHHPGVAVITNT